MKKIVVLILSLALVFGLASCSKETEVAVTAEETNAENVEKEEEQEEQILEEDESELEIVENEETIIVYAGSINQSYPIHMTIVKNGTKAIGSYYYDSRKINIPFTGEINGDSLFITTDDGSETFDGNFYGKEINGTWTMGETVYDFNLIEESKIDTSTDDQASLKEEIILEFNLVETGERVGIYVDSNNEYMVFRLAKDGEIIVEGPNFDESSWDYFSLYSYHRGGGVENEGLDIAQLTYSDGSSVYRIGQEYSAVENKTSYFFNISENEKEEGISYTVDESTVVGDLRTLANYDKIKIE